MNKILDQEGLHVYEDAGAGTAQPILQDDEGRIDRENLWAPTELAVTVTVAGGHNKVAASPSEMLNQMMQGGNCGHGTVGGGRTNGCGTSAPPPNEEASPVRQQQVGSGQS